MEQSPPFAYLKIVVDHCPSAASTYLSLWTKRDKDNQIVVEKKKIWNEFLIPHVKFKTHLMKLCREGLISIRDTATEYDIELVNFEEMDFSDEMLC